MRLIAASSVLALLLGCAHASPAEASSPAGQETSKSVVVNSTVLGDRFTYKIAPESLTTEPEWAGPGSGPAPITMDAAIALAERDISKYFADVENWRVKRVELRSLCCPERWFYIVSWLPAGARGDALGIPVLMSGHTIPLTRDVERGSNVRHRVP